MKKKHFLLSVFLLVFLTGFSQDGSPDLSFGNNGVVETDFDNNWDEGRLVTTTPSGNIYVTASASYYYPNDKIILGYLSDGSINTSFGNSGVFHDNMFQNIIKTSTQGENLLALFFDSSGTYNIFKLLPVGILENSFATSGVLTVTSNNQTAIDFIVLPDDKILVLGKDNSGAVSEIMLKRFMPNGVIDTSFGNNGVVVIQAADELNNPISMALGNNENIYISGKFKNIGANVVNGVVKVSINGVFDTTYGNNGIGEIPVSYDFYCGKIGVLNDGSVVSYCDYIDNVNEIIYSNMHKINSQGNSDTTFGNGGIINTYGFGGVLVQQNNRFIVYDLGWDFFEGGGILTLRRFYANGNQDNSFQHTINYNELFNIDAVLQPDGKILVTGTSAWYNGYTDVVLLRYNNTVLGVQDSAVNTVELFPNPVVNNLIVKGNLSKSAFGIFDITGKQVLNGNLGIGETQIDVSSLQSGMYLFKTTTGFVQKIVKQ